MKAERDVEEEKNVENSFWPTWTHDSCVFTGKNVRSHFWGEGRTAWIWEGFIFLFDLTVSSSATFNFLSDWFRFSPETFRDDFFSASILGPTLGFRFLFGAPSFLRSKSKQNGVSLFEIRAVYPFRHYAGFKFRLIAAASKRYQVYRKFLIRLNPWHANCVETWLRLSQYQRFQLGLRNGCPHFREMRDAQGGTKGCGASRCWYWGYRITLERQNKTYWQILKKLRWREWNQFFTIFIQGIDRWIEPSF